MLKNHRPTAGGTPKHPEEYTLIQISKRGLWPIFFSGSPLFPILLIIYKCFLHLQCTLKPFFCFSPAVDDVQNVQIVCVWCQKEGVKRYSLCMGSELKSFCSEKCFAACRRAYFKRNKVGGKICIQYISTSL